jgi:glycosyltransferase involved in cell wall biosynthesis
LLVIPARNESGRIEHVVAAARARLGPTTVLVVDDGSADDTAERAAAAGARVLRHPFNLGYGAALQTGYNFALRNRFTQLVQMLGDGQPPAAAVPALLQALDGGQDVVLGSRFRNGCSSATTGLRRFGSRLLAWVVRRWTGADITDPTSGLQALSERAVRLLAMEGFPEDYPDADVLIGLHQNGCRLTEIPVVMEPRRGGVSMHRGARILYYAYKMTLCLVLLPVRRRSPYRREWRSAPPTSTTAPSRKHRSA